MATGVTRLALAACVLVNSHGRAQDAPAPDQIKKGAAIYSQNCSPCHGPRMLDPQGAFDLRAFPRDQKERYITSVAKGKNQMPPWAGLLSPEDIEALWAYTIAGEK
jgi:mono/diheme cytochrome c family protein